MKSKGMVWTSIVEQRQGEVKPSGVTAWYRGVAKRTVMQGQSGAGHGRAMAKNCGAERGFSNEGNGNEANS